MASFHWQTNNTFDPFNQTFTVLAPDGVTPVAVEMAALRTLQTTALVGGICEGTQIGAAALLLLCLLLVTKTDKRRSIVFILNATALLLVVIRGVFTCLNYTGPFHSWYRWEMYYYAHLSGAQAVSIAAEATDFLLVCVLELSLVTQVRIVCCTLEPQWRYMVNALNIFVALLEIGARFAMMVLTIDWNILGVEHETLWQFDRLGQLGLATNILLVVSIGISAATFCAKLGFAIRTRRSMGMKQFGPMQIIFVMGCQTMCTPFVFVMIAYFAMQNADVQSFVRTVVALSLPLSAMWATANTTHVHVADPDPQRRHAIPIRPCNLASAKAYGGSKSTKTTTATTISDTLFDDDISATPISPTKSSGPNRHSRPDVEMQQLAGGVHVDRTFSVRSD